MLSSNKVIHLLFIRANDKKKFWLKLETKIFSRVTVVKPIFRPSSPGGRPENTIACDRSKAYAVHGRVFITVEKFSSIVDTVGIDIGGNALTTVDHLIYMSTPINMLFELIERERKGNERSVDAIRI